MRQVDVCKCMRIKVRRYINVLLVEMTLLMRVLLKTIDKEICEKSKELTFLCVQDFVGLGSLFKYRPNIFLSTAFAHALGHYHIQKTKNSRTNNLKICVL